MLLSLLYGFLTCCVFTHFCLKYGKISVLKKHHDKLFLESSVTWVIFAGQPFWRLWNAAGSDGRGVIGPPSAFKSQDFRNFWLMGYHLWYSQFMSAGVLEANFVEPAHDKQGFERTNVLARLEGRLVQMQKNYWFGIFGRLFSNCSLWVLSCFLFFLFLFWSY